MVHFLIILGSYICGLITLMDIVIKQTVLNRSPARKLEIYKNMSEAKKGKQTGSDNPNAKPIEIEGIRYKCMKDAYKALGLSEGTVVKRLKSDLYPTWKYLPIIKERNNEE